MANGAFTLQGFESPEEVQSRIGKAEEAALRPKGDINSLIYQTAARGESALGSAVQGATGYEAPEVKTARQVQEIMKGLDPSDPQSYFEGSKRLNQAGMTKEALYMADKGNELVSDRTKASKTGRGEYHRLEDMMLPTGELDKEGNPVLANYKVPFNARTGKSNMNDKVLSPKDASIQGRVAASKATGRVKGTDVAQAQIDLPQVQGDATYMKSLLDGLVTHEGFQTSVGAGLGFATKFLPASDAAAWQARFKQIEGKKFMTAYQSLKGGGQITEIEGVKATEAASRMKAATSEEEFIEAVSDYKAEIDRAVSIAEKRSGMTKAEVKEDQKNSEANLILDQARSAIARGADKKKVIVKLIKGFKKKGYDANLIGGL